MCLTFPSAMQARSDYPVRHRKRVAGVELWRSFAAASVVVERRQASALRSARAAPKRGSWTTRLSAFRLPSFFFLLSSFFFLICFFLGFAGLDRDESPDSTAGFAQRSPESKRFVPFSCRLPHASDADRIARTMALGLASPQGQRKSEPLLPSWPGLSRPSTSWALLQVRRGCPARGRA
jgi:hypothetical protein